MCASPFFPWDLVALTPSPLQSLLKLRDLSSTQLCSYRDLPVDLTNQVALVARGNCTFYEKVRLAQGSGARALLVVSKEKLVGCRVPVTCGWWDSVGGPGFRWTLKRLGRA